MSTNGSGEHGPAFFGEAEHLPFLMGNGDIGALLLHGFMGTPAEMRPLAERLASYGMATRGPLLPGFGPDVPNLAKRDRHRWLAAAANDWLALQRDARRRVLIGYSMGAALAIHLAADTPPDALILVAPFWRSGGWQFNLLPILRHFVPSIAPFEKANFDDPDVRAQMASMAPGVDLTDPATQQFLREQVRLPLAVLDELRVLGKEAYSLASTIQVPTLIIQGGQDEVVAPEDTRRLAQQMGHVATYEEIQADHSVIRLATPQTSQLGERIVAFLTNLGVAPSSSLVAEPTP